MRIAMITSGYFPVPNSCGGAVEYLSTLLLKGAESSDTCVHLEVISCWDKKAEEMSTSFVNSEFVFVKTKEIIRILDRIIYSFARYVLRKKKPFSYRYILQRFFYIKNVRKILAEQNYDAILVENHPLLFLPFKDKEISKKYEGKIFFHLHNELSGLYGCKEQISSIRGLIGISEFVCRSFLNTLPGFDSRKCFVLKNTIEIERYATHKVEPCGFALRKKYGIEKDELVVLYSGRLSPEKGVRELLLAFDNIINVVPHARLVIAGASYYSSGTTSVYEGELKKIAKHLGRKVIFTGYVEYEKMPIYYAMSDVCVTPSLWEEPACMSAIEAIAAGKPLIATKSGGMIEYLDDTFAILLDRGPYFVESLSDALIEILLNKEKRTSMAEAASMMRMRFSAKRYFDNFIDILRLTGFNFLERNNR